MARNKQSEPAAVDRDTYYRVVLRRRAEIAPGVWLDGAGPHLILGSALADLGDAVLSREPV